MSFLRWMGGKSQVVHLFKEYFPDINKCKGYIEPFIGGGSVFFFVKQNYDLTNKSVYLSDINEELINCHRMVRDNVKDIIPLLKIHEKFNREKGIDYYYEIRNKYPPGHGMTNIEKAAAFIYLSKSCFGGMWRVNSDGKMNTSYSGNTDLRVADKDIYYYSGLLKDTKIIHSSFENILKVNGGDLRDWFVYLDPPYYDVGVKDYAKDGFSLDTKGRIITVFKELDKRGTKVMMSNSNGPTTRSYFKDYNIHIIETNRLKGVKLDNITKDKIEDAKTLNEVVVTNFDYIRKQLTMDDYE